MDNVPIENGLLDALPSSTRKRMFAACESIELLPSAILHEAGDRLRHVYFPTAGFISMMTPAETCASIEVGMVGREGMVGIPLLMGVAASSLHYIVHGAGGALRITAACFRGELERSRALRNRLGLYAYANLQQVEQIAACIRFHTVEQRLARWLLTAHDRASSSLRATHLSLAKALGVRRSGVTNAAASLQHAGFIHYSRGDITILDRAGLQARACGCYAATGKTYGRIVETPSSGAR